MAMAMAMAATPRRYYRPMKRRPSKTRTRATRRASRNSNLEVVWSAFWLSSAGRTCARSRSEARRSARPRSTRRQREPIRPRRHRSASSSFRWIAASPRFASRRDRRTSCSTRVWSCASTIGSAHQRIPRATICTNSVTLATLRPRRERCWSSTRSRPMPSATMLSRRYRLRARPGA